MAARPEPASGGAMRARRSPPRTLTLLGATGRTGRHLLRLALHGGYRVRALVRDPRALASPHPRLELVPGDACELGAMEQAVAGASVVLSTLGHTPSSADDVLTQAARNLVEVARRRPIERVVALISGSILVPGDRPPLGYRCLTHAFRPLFRRRFTDSRRQAEVILGSGLDYVLVRATRLSDEPGTGEVEAGPLDGRVRPTIPRVDVAAFMLEQVWSDAFLHQTPLVRRPRRS
ncbi:hypothetical protein PPSIR1_35267 [Plesiocystis pacifica SIR-1]|uniref:NAD(P)-binding domain-containing protein n=2 Tax=Plesiocystis pacifica TaxID=191768 RepID=A6G3W1_9BACT|nr:hypothetical protein PPSIR1_35267 [Plesiocystis pacifica SIR-1]